MTQIDNDGPSKPPHHGDAEAEPKKKRAKKERVLHTRIPAVLEAELKALAGSLKVPVSNLVRTILEDSVVMADRAGDKLETKLKDAARSVHDERERLRTKLNDDAKQSAVVAYQNVMVAKAVQCARCDAALPPGEDAALAITERPTKTKRFVCKVCLPAALGDLDD